MNGIRTPFRGLRSFQTDDAALFFGRDEVIDDVIDRLSANRAVVILGPSGSGKSSLVRAGVLPALLSGHAETRLAVFRPGVDALGNLANALERAQIPAPIDTLRASTFGVVQSVAAALRPRERLVMVVDQFEEIFRLRRESSHAEDADTFAGLLASTIASDAPIHVVITLRADFTADLAQLYHLPEALSHALVLIPRMNRRQLTEAIERPLEEVGGAIEPSCVQQILNDLNDVPDALPRLQHLLLRMWESWQEGGSSRSLGREDYERAGTIADALGRHGDEILQSLPEPERTLPEWIFRSLSTEEGGRIYGQPTTITEIAAIAGSTPEMVMRVAEPFIAGGLLSSAAADGMNSFLQLGHDVLLREWTRAAAWAREESAAKNTYLRLVYQARAYQQSEGSLLQGPELMIATEWIRRLRPTSAWASRYADAASFPSVVDYIERSDQQHGSERVEQERQRFEELRRHERLLQRRRSAGWFLILAVLLLTFLVLLMRR